MTSTRSEPLTYDDRLDTIFEIVQHARPSDIAASDVRARVPWDADSHEIRSKLNVLRRQGAVEYDPETKRWYA